MYEWHKLIHIMVDEVDERIKCHNDALTLKSLSKKLGYSEFHITRRFKEISGMLFKDYIRHRKLAFALIELRDTKDKILDIAVKYGFKSHEAFTRSFKMVYGITPEKYRKKPLPVVLRTKLSTFDRFFFGLGEIGMAKSTEEVKTYFITISSHKYLHIKNYESNGYWDFWKKQEKILGQDWDTIRGLLDSIKNLDSICGKYSGQVMAKIYENDGVSAEGYGIRLPIDYSDPIPKNMLLMEIPEMEYIVFEHGPFNYEEENETVERKLKDSEISFDYSTSDYKPDTSSGRAAYFYHIPNCFKKRIQPVIKK